MISPATFPAHNDALINQSLKPASAIGRAFYLASSWTWCIGMFLPLVLIRDFGPWAWLVFAAPNVIGAAAMGWVLHRPGASESIIAAHRPAMRLFSLITVAFHAAFFLLVLAPMTRFFDLPAWVLFLPATLFVVSRGIGGVISSILVYLVSVIAMLHLIDDGAIARAQSALPAPIRPAGDLLFMLPICTFGFLLCPYLDLTFHRARRQTTSSGAKLAFTLGFGVLFLLMIAATPLYGPLFWDESTRKEAVLAAMAPCVWIHIASQLFFTCGIHSSECGDDDSATGTLKSSFWSRLCMLILPLALLAAWLGAKLLPEAPLLATSSNTALIWYRLFLSAYGLLLPAYVWLCMIPRRGEKTVAPTSRHIAIWLLACLAASPFYWLGFMERQTVWLIPGLAIVLASRALIPLRVLPARPLRSA